MATAWADVVAAALVVIDDARLEEQMAVSPAQFYRRMSAMVSLAIPLLALPPELLRYLKNGLVRPQYDDYAWTSEESAEPVAVDTALTGYQLCSVTRRISHDNGTVTLAPYAGALYDPETGVVTMPPQDQDGIAYDFDFYTDGSFPDLSEKQMRLMALAVAVVWDERFSRNWLGMTPKIHDESFSVVNEANYTDKVTKRLHDNRIAFQDELRSYEQLCAYHAVVRNRGNMTLV